MKRTVLTFALLAVSVASGQWPRTIYLDTLQGIDAPNCITYNPNNNCLYVAGDNPWFLPEPACIAVVDCETLRRTAQIGRPISTPNDIACNPRLNKVYVCNEGYRGGTLSVVDCATNSLIANVVVGWSPSAVSINPLNDKVYVACEGSDAVDIVDGHGDTVLARVPVGDEPASFCFNTRNNKVYCAAPGGWATWWDTAIAVIDGVSDTLIREVQVGVGPVSLCYSSASHKVYIANGASYGRNPVDSTISVLDAETDEVLRTIVPGFIPMHISYQPRENRVYVLCHERQPGRNGHVAIIDCATDSIVKRIPVSIGPRLAPCGAVLLSDSTTNRMYVLDIPRSELTVIDCRTDSVSGVVQTGVSPWDATTGRPGTLFTCNHNTRDLTVVDTDSLRTIGRVFVGWQDVRAILACPDTALVYCAHGLDKVSVINAASQEVSYVLKVGNYPSALLHVPTTGRVYCANRGGGKHYPDSTVSILDPATRSVVDTVVVGLEPTALCYNDLEDKVYVANYGGASVSVIDAASGAVLATVPTDSNPRHICYNPNANKVYVTCHPPQGRSVFVIDGARDSVRTVHRGFGIVYWIIPCPDVNRTYFHGAAMGGANYLHAIDCDTDSLVAHPQVHFGPGCAIYVPEDTTLWLSAVEWDLLCAFDCRSDTIIVYFNLPGCERAVQLRASPQSGRLYGTCPRSQNVAVVDMDSRSLTGRVEMGLMNGVMELGGEPLYVYVGSDLSKMYFFPDTMFVGISARREAQPLPRTMAPTLMRSGTPLRTAAHATLLSITGRKVMDLHPGENDIRHVAPGIYFIREEQTRTTRKVIVTR